MLWLEEQDPLISLHHSGVSFVTAIPDIYWVFAVCQPLFFLFKKIFVSSSEDIFSFLLEREEKRENHQCEREASIGCLPNAPRPGTVHSLTGDGNHSLGMCPEQEPNPQPFGYGTMLQPTEPHWPGLPGTVLSSLHLISQLIFVASLWGGFHHLRSTDQEPEAQSLTSE